MCGCVHSARCVRVCAGVRGVCGVCAQRGQLRRRAETRPELTGLFLRFTSLPCHDRVKKKGRVEVRLPARISQGAKRLKLSVGGQEALRAVEETDSPSWVPCQDI